jgi:hypothetical protein
MLVGHDLEFFFFFEKPINVLLVYKRFTYFASIQNLVNGFSENWLFKALHCKLFILTSTIGNYNRNNPNC